MANITRPHQVVVWGATGFTGRLVCEHLATHYQGRVRWAIAGRNAAKLEQLRKDLSKVNPSCNDVPILTADLKNKSSLKDMLSATDVVISTVGPFSLHGTLLVESSVEEGTHYCDITGEVPWVKQNYLKYNQEAERKQVRIVHACGYDSVPTDLGTYFVADYVKKELGKSIDRVDAIVHAEEVKGSFSGGTIESMFSMSKVFGSVEVSKSFMDPYYLVPQSEGKKKGTDSMSSLMPGYNYAVGRATGLSIMEVCNSRMVQMSNALRKEPYGPDFKVHEFLGFRGWLAGRLAAALTTGVILLFGAVLGSPVAPMIRRFLPAPGQGPSRDALLNGYWAQTVVATTYEHSGAKAQIAKALVAHRHGDPGYYSTSRMLLECALCLALQKDQLDAADDVKKGGVMSPAVAFGMTLVNRLRAAGYEFEIVGGRGVGAPAGLVAAEPVAQPVAVK